MLDLDGELDILLCDLCLSTIPDLQYSENLRTYTIHVELTYLLFFEISSRYRSDNVVSVADAQRPVKRKLESSFVMSASSGYEIS